MILEMNKQRITVDYIELYKLQVPGGWLCFTTYHEAVYFRDKESPYTNREYIPLPIEFTGFEQKSEGAYARPKVSFANVLTTFSDALGTLTNDDLIDMKIVRRKTLKTHIDNAAGDANGAAAAPTEYPTQSFIIDRIEREDSSMVTFELASPFDLAGIMLPNRNIIPNTCSWAYQGIATDSPFSTPIGACHWKLAANNNNITAYFDNKNNLFVTGHTITATSNPGTINELWKESRSVTRVNPDNSLSSTTGYDYYQSGGTGITYRRVRLYTTYNASSTYYTFKEGELYNDVVLYGETLWSCIKSYDGSVAVQTPAIGSSYWKRADICGKKLSSCAIRFGSYSATISTGTIVSVVEDKSGVIPYGGFPASRRYNYTG